MNFLPDSFARYRPGGPRTAYGGCIGVVLNPTPKSLEHGWVRVDFGARVDDYSEDELEAAQFWAYLSGSEERWRGPFASWSNAAEGVADLLRAATAFTAGHPLVHKRDSLISELTVSDPVPTGIVGYHPRAGEARVVVAGVDQPSLWNKFGKDMLEKTQ